MEIQFVFFAPMPVARMPNIPVLNAAMNAPNAHNIVVPFNAPTNTIIIANTNTIANAMFTLSLANSPDDTYTPLRIKFGGGSMFAVEVSRT